MTGENEMCSELKSKFDNWMLGLNPYYVTSNIFFFIAVLNFWNVFNFFLMLFCGILWRYAGLQAGRVEELKEAPVEAPAE